MELVAAPAEAADMFLEDVPAVLGHVELGDVRVEDGHQELEVVPSMEGHRGFEDARAETSGSTVPPPELNHGRPVDAMRLRALTLAEAALVVGRHESTIRRYLKAERFPNAFRDGDGVWLIPVADLADSALLSRSPEGDHPGIVAQLDAELGRRAREIEELRHRLAAAEALAEERAERIRELGLSLRAFMRTSQAEVVEARPRSEPRQPVWSGEIALKDG